ncbi:hypothetical protein SOVF_108810, partial [Spinacia oleracea]
KLSAHAPAPAPAAARFSLVSTESVGDLATATRLKKSAPCKHKEEISIPKPKKPQEYC